LLSVVDGSKVTSNLWGERWSKLCHNAMRNGVSAATGLAGREIDQHEDIRHFTIKIGGEAVRIGQALGYELEKIGKLDPAKLALAGDGDAARSRRSMPSSSRNRRAAGAASCSVPPWARTCSRDAAPKSNSSTAISSTKARRLALPPLQRQDQFARQTRRAAESCR
jgi:hypothetical protein